MDNLPRRGLLVTFIWVLVFFLYFASLYVIFLNCQSEGGLKVDYQLLPCTTENILLYPINTLFYLLPYAGFILLPVGIGSFILLRESKTSVSLLLNLFIITGGLLIVYFISIIQPYVMHQIKSVKYSEQVVQILPTYFPKNIGAKQNASGKLMNSSYLCNNAREGSFTIKQEKQIDSQIHSVDAEYKLHPNPSLEERRIVMLRNTKGIYYIFPTAKRLAFYTPDSRFELRVDDSCQIVDIENELVKVANSILEQYTK